MYWLCRLLFGSAFLLFIAGCSGDEEPKAAGTAGMPSSNLQISAERIEFNKDQLVAPLDSDVTLQFENNDSGVLHNVAIYQTDSADDEVFVGDLFEGEATRTYEFRTPGPGTYFFRCDVHPDQMTGTFIVR